MLMLLSSLGLAVVGEALLSGIPVVAAKQSSGGNVTSGAPTFSRLSASNATALTAALQHVGSNPYVQLTDTGSYIAVQPEPNWPNAAEPLPTRCAELRQQPTCATIQEHIMSTA